MSDEMIAHDTWNYSPPKLAKLPIIELGHVTGVLPFDGVRNPGSRSSTSHKVWFGYRTPANDWKHRLGICESAAEFAVALEALMLPNTYDVKFQPMTVQFELDGKKRHYAALAAFRDNSDPRNVRCLSVVLMKTCWWPI
ncbi:hypothetical protein [Sedimentitalea arenosa]|uniref:Uncharacterized protein n=1 Tax=Sedimentitalea arenosa TaxID=2798803 RepID=A0A8J7LSC7_9RHOB|nr:hypothetical protein [Arenibacterium arenosum]MBJ6372718.1 hypothetical protein [Arenibacterium arenosum]